MAENSYFDQTRLKNWQVDDIAWDRLRDESALSFQRFCIYRDMGVKRSLAKVAKTLAGEGQRVSRQRLAEQAARYRWLERVAAYDLHLHKQLQLTAAAERRAARKRQCDLGVALQRVAQHALAEMLDKIRAGIPLHLTPTEISNLAAAGQELERSGLGDTHDPRLIPEIQVICDGKPMRNMMSPEPDEDPPRKPN